MRNLFLILNISVLSFFGYSQPILNNSNTNPMIGDILSTFSYQWVSPGPSGANQTWDFSSITSTTTSGNQTYTYTTIPSSVTSQFPNGNIYGQAGNYNYIYKTSNASLEYLGYYYNPNPNTSFILQDYMDVLHYPFTYNSNFTDSYNGIKGPVGSELYTKTTETVIADGYGTIILPEGTFSNVLRVHVLTFEKDSTYNSGNPFIYTYTNDNYFWYLPNNHNPILENYTQILAANTYHDMYKLQNISNGLNEFSNNIKSLNFYPNPNNSAVLNLDLNLNENITYKVIIVDNLGREVLTTKNNQGFLGYNFSTIDISSLKNGLYQFEILSEESKLITNKLIINK